MKAFLFRILLAFLRLYTPKWVIRKEIRILAGITARAFGTTGINPGRMKPEDALYAYAGFTRECIDRLHHQSDSLERNYVKARLYKVAFKVGTRIRYITGFWNSRDQEKLIIWLYRNIRITMKKCRRDFVLISDCCFSQMYTPEHCEFMSYLDSGIIAGICRYEGKKLKFRQRITEDHGGCIAEMVQLEEQE